MESMRDSLNTSVNTYLDNNNSSRSYTSDGLSQIQSDDTYDLSSVIPLYKGDVSKSNIDVCRKRNDENTASKKDCRIQIRNTCNKGSKRNSENSYLLLFHSRIGYPTNLSECKRAVPDSARAIDGDLTFRSVQSTLSQSTEIFEDAQEQKSDSESFYANYLQQKSNYKHPEDLRSMTSTSITSSSINKLRSVSEQVLDTIQPDQERISRRSRHLRKMIINTPLLGRLGPDIETVRSKQEIFKKRQMYGQKVNEQNKIKSMERKLLVELQTEIQVASSKDSISNTKNKEADDKP